MFRLFLIIFLGYFCSSFHRVRDEVVTVNLEINVRIPLGDGEFEITELENIELFLSDGVIFIEDFEVFDGIIFIEFETNKNNVEYRITSVDDDCYYHKISVSELGYNSHWRFNCGKTKLKTKILL
jgi:hypothetical protein